MIKIKTSRNTDGQIVALNVCGHAGWGGKGQDIVCAAVSALTQAALLGLKKQAGACLDYKVQKEPALLTFTLTSPPDDKTDAILETMLLGLAEIVKAYPGNLDMTEDRRGNSHV
jgi:uncharacterized protein YsxB (DUF464 family)